MVWILFTVVDCGSESQVCHRIYGMGRLLITSCRSVGKGIFSAHHSLEILYYRMLGARIGKNVKIGADAILGEFDLLNLQDECKIDTSQVRGFSVETDGHFRLDYINIGRKAVINTYTVVSPGATLSDGTVLGPHASSHDGPSPSSYAAYNRTLIPQPNWLLMVFVAWPIIIVVWVISRASTCFCSGYSLRADLFCKSDIPWFLALALLMNQAKFSSNGLQPLESVILRFASGGRIAFHMVSVVARAVLVPLLHLVLGIAVKRMLGFNTPCAAANATQLTILRRYVNSVLLSRGALHRAFMILGSHYEIVSVSVTSSGSRCRA